MPPTGDKRDNRIALAFHKNEIEGITVAGPTRVCRAAWVLCQRRSQRLEIEIHDFLARIDGLGTNACADKCRSWNRERKIE